MFDVKQALKSGLRQFGLEIQRLPRSLAPEQVSVGHDPYHDMRRFTAGIAAPVFFDVGANVGQSVERIRTYFDHPVIHAFEPAPDTFERLRSNTRDIPNLTLSFSNLDPIVGVP